MLYFLWFELIESKVINLLKFSWSFCLLIATVVSTSYGDDSQGLRVEVEAPVSLELCPASDDPNHTVMLPYPKDCRKYYTCLNGKGYAHQCPDNYYWSQITYRCDFKQYSNCEQTIDPPISKEESVQYSAFPGDCSRYYGTQTLSCPTNYHWNARSQRCDLPEVAGCASSTSYSSTSTPPNDPTAATPPTVIQTTGQPGSRLPIDPELLCKSAGQMKYVPYPDDCHKFIYCGPTASVLYCASNLYWNKNTQSCDLSNAGC